MKLTDLERVARMAEGREEPKESRAERLTDEIMSFREFTEIPLITNLEFPTSSGGIERLDEGQWFSGRFPRNIRQDHATHLLGNGKTHAHVQGRKGDDYVIVNVDGTSSHGMKGKLHKKDADTLRSMGYAIPSSNIVEWLEINSETELLLG